MCMSAIICVVAVFFCLCLFAIKFSSLLSRVFYVGVLQYSLLAPKNDDSVVRSKNQSEAY